MRLKVKSRLERGVEIFGEGQSRVVKEILPRESTTKG